MHTFPWNCQRIHHTLQTYAKLAQIDELSSNGDVPSVTEFLSFWPQKTIQSEAEILINGDPWRHHYTRQLGMDYKSQIFQFFKRLSTSSTKWICEILSKDRDILPAFTAVSNSSWNFWRAKCIMQKTLAMEHDFHWGKQHIAIYRAPLSLRKPISPGATELWCPCNVLRGSKEPLCHFCAKSCARAARPGRGGNAWSFKKCRIRCLLTYPPESERGCVDFLIAEQRSR